MNNRTIIWKEWIEKWRAKWKSFFVQHLAASNNEWIKSEFLHTYIPHIQTQKYPRILVHTYAYWTFPRRHPNELTRKDVTAHANLYTFVCIYTYIHTYVYARKWFWNRMSAQTKAVADTMATNGVAPGNTENYDRTVAAPSPLTVSAPLTIGSSKLVRRNSSWRCRWAEEWHNVRTCFHYSKGLIIKTRCLSNGIGKT